MQYFYNLGKGRIIDLCIIFMIVYTRTCVASLVIIDFLLIAKCLVALRKGVYSIHIICFEPKNKLSCTSAKSSYLASISYTYFWLGHQGTVKRLFIGTTIRPKPSKNSDPKSPHRTWSNGQKNISRYCPFKQVSYRRTLTEVSYNQGGALQIGYPRRCPTERAFKEVPYR